MPARPGWRRGLLFAALLLLGLAYVGAFWVFVTRSEDFIAREIRQRAQQHATTHPLAVGDALAFGHGGNGVAHLGTGWHVADDGGVWSRQDEAELFLAAVADAPIRIALQLNAFVEPGGHPAPVRLVVDGIEQGAWQLPPTATALSAELVLPAVAAGALRHLAIESDASRSPVLAGTGDDPRRLGVHLQRLHVVADAP